MKYLIKLEDRKSGRVAFVECPANMPIERLSVNIKVELRLPFCDHGVHCFRRGLIYAPDDIDRFNLEELLGWYVPFPNRKSVLSSMKLCRSSERARLNRVFTVIGSTVVYEQLSVEGCNRAICTLVDKY